MSDEEIRESTASDRLTLEEEYEMCRSWSNDEDKLTFIIIERDRSLLIKEEEEEEEGREGGYKSKESLVRDIQLIHQDSSKMIGDVNLFLSPDGSTADDEDVEKNDEGIRAELEIMIASKSHRSRGLATESLRLFLSFIILNFRINTSNLKTNINNNLITDIDRDRESAEEEDHLNQNQVDLKLLSDNDRVMINHLFVKISTDNSISQNLFKKLGFKLYRKNLFFNEVEYRLDFNNSIIRIINQTKSKNKTSSKIKINFNESKRSEFDDGKGLISDDRDLVNFKDLRLKTIIISSDKFKQFDRSELFRFSFDHYSNNRNSSEIKFFIIDWP
ncbi:GNAT domain-containing protein [Phakopsora pachyrhizi]|nr:GNAT domain-containing protein [Phakopsora pachyrhizi]